MSQRGEPVAGTGPAPRYGPACLCGVLSKSPLSSRPLSSLSPPRSGALSSLPPHWQVRPGVGHHRGKGLMDWVSRTGLTEQETSLWGRPLREERDTRTNTRDGGPNGRRRAPFLSRAWPRSRSGSREPKGALCRVVPGGARRQLTKGRGWMPDDARRRGRCIRGFSSGPARFCLSSSWRSRPLPRRPRRPPRHFSAH